jgi:ATP-dependent DNA helicase RecG
VSLSPEALAELIQQGETVTVEFKVAAPRQAELAERICGFANSKLGGLLVIGVEDKTWQVVGVKNVSETVDTVLHAARMCKPSVELEPAQPEIVTVGGKTLVVATIPPNNGRLYQAGGVFWLRRGSHTTPLEVAEVERYLYQSGALSWETQPVLTATLDDLDLRLVERYLEQRPSRSRAVASGRLSNLERILINLGCAVEMADASDPAKSGIARPTNAGMLLFGYSPQEFLLQSEVVCVQYGDNLGLRKFSDRRILHGTLAEQIDQAENWLRQYITVAGRVEGFHRIDEPDYPLEALREAVVNAVVHRDYSLKGTAVRVFFYADRVEIRNPGTLMPDVNLETLKQGEVQSSPRNPILASVLRDIPGGYMERMGSGIAFMINQMRALGKADPEFRTQNEFIVTFFRQGATAEVSGAGTSPMVRAVAEQSPTGKAELTQTERQRLALRYIHEHGRITNKQYRELTGVAEKTAFRDLEILVEQGTLKAVGERRGRYYTLQ